MGFLWFFYPHAMTIVPLSQRPGFKWIAEAQLVPHPTRISGAGPSVTEPAADAGGDAGPKFVLTPYGWRTVEQAGGLTQVRIFWRKKKWPEWKTQPVIFVATKAHL